MRHAFLIIAHNEFKILQRLVSMLDSEGNDIYIHFDKKVKQVPSIHTEKSAVFFPQERIDVRWGNVSQIKTELVLFKTALNNGPYDFYHLISGTHLPLKDIQGLDAFYSRHQGEEVMRFWPDDPGDADFKLRRYHLFSKGIRNSRAIAWRIIIKIQKVLGIRHFRRETFLKTDNWKSLSQKGVEYLTRNADKILSRYRFSLCGDEYYAASELNMHPEQFHISDCPELLYVRFNKSNPYTLTLKDYESLKDSEYIWARKFTENEQ